MKQIAIITVVYNNYAVLDDFFASFKKQSATSYRLFIADASSKPQTISAPGVPHTAIPIDNKGYARGINIGLKQAIKDGYTRFCVMNDDVFFEKNFIKRLHNAFEKNPNTIFGGKIYYASGYEYHKNNYQPEELGQVIWYAGGTVDWSHATTSHRGVDEVDRKQYVSEEKTEFVTGCLMCFDRNVVDAIGYWDENYFLYYEDADYCERAKKNSIPLWYIPSIKIWHKNAQSTDGSGSTIHQKYQKKAQLRYALKFAPFKSKMHVAANYFLRR